MLLCFVETKMEHITELIVHLVLGGPFDVVI